jgi:hypothetical protein
LQVCPRAFLPAGFVASCYLLGLLGLIPPLDELGLVVLLPFIPLLPDPVVPLNAPGYFFINALHCESCCIEFGDMPWHFVSVVFSLLVMLDMLDWAKLAPVNAAAMPTASVKVANVFIGSLLVSRGEGTSRVPPETRGCAKERSCIRELEGKFFAQSSTIEHVHIEAGDPRRIGNRFDPGDAAIGESE